MSVTSCQQKIPLYLAYYNVFPIDVSPASVSTIQEAIVYAFFILKKQFGASEAEIVSYVSSTFPEYTTDVIEAAFTSMVRTGALVILQPICRDWCADECPIKLYAISSRISQIPVYAPLVLFLVQLAGGTRTISNTFRRWFSPDNNFKGGQLTVASTRRPVMSSMCP